MVIILRDCPIILYSMIVCTFYYQSHSQNDSGDLRGVTGGDGKLGCLCGKAGTSHMCGGSAHSSGCMVNGYSFAQNCVYGIYLYCNSVETSSQGCIAKLEVQGDEAG